MEDTLLTPMQEEDILSEAGRFGVLVRLIEDDFISKVGREAQAPGFYEVFAFLYGLLDEMYIQQELLSVLPYKAYELYKLRRVQSEETDIVYPFPEENSPMCDMAILYCAFAHSISKREEAYKHLPYLCSLSSSIEDYVQAGYHLVPEANDVRQEVVALMQGREKENQMDLYLTMEERLTQVYFAVQ